jgi:hypothetical protein
MIRCVEVHNYLKYYLIGFKLDLNKKIVNMDD